MLHVSGSVNRSQSRWHNRRGWLVAGVLACCLATACSRSNPTCEPVLPAAARTPTLAPSGYAVATRGAPPQPSAGVLSPQEQDALSTLQQLDSHPLYTMCMCGEVAASRAPGEPKASAALQPAAPRVQQPAPLWGCSLFAALGNPQSLLYGRNFDWTASPALLLFTDPPDGYASVAMVDIAYLGYDGQAAVGLADLPLAERAALLDAPALPFDGMNEQGLAVGMAAVPAGDMRTEPGKPTIGSLRLMRVMLDQARDVEEALAIAESYNVDFGGGPPIHYLIADATGQAILVEFYQGRMAVLPNERPWHLATNFLRAAVERSAQGQCWRYDRLSERLEAAAGRLDAGEAMALLREVAQPNTQWSIVYDVAAREVHVALDRGYHKVVTLPFELCGRFCGQ